MGIVSAWYRKSSWLYLLLPLSWLYVLLAKRRRIKQEANRVPSAGFPPIIIVGNITVGGTGKTPLIIALTQSLQAQGLRVGIVSRGYGGNSTKYPAQVNSDSSVEEKGDEAVMIKRNVDCPLVVDPVRVNALNALLEAFPCDVVLSDDGLQHYKLPRSREIVVLDGDRLLGNGFCLPAGPLREEPQRLGEVDYVIVNGGNEAQWRTTLSEHATLPTAGTMRLEPTAWVNLHSGRRVALDALPMSEGASLHALAGIGNPERFFKTVQDLGFKPLCHPFPDHYTFTTADLKFAGKDTVVMTHKDAVKCEKFASKHCWYLEVNAVLEQALMTTIVADIQSLVAPITPQASQH